MPKPGEYRQDVDHYPTSTEDLPPAKVIQRSRNFRNRPCPCCGRKAPRHKIVQRTVHDLGNPELNQPCDICITYSQHRCQHCGKIFNAQHDDIAAPKTAYTKRVSELAVRVVVEDGLPYRQASWHLWRDRRVFVPFATIQNWVEAAGEKSGTSRKTRQLSR